RGGRGQPSGPGPDRLLGGLRPVPLGAADPGTAGRGGAAGRRQTFCRRRPARRRSLVRWPGGCGPRRRPCAHPFVPEGVTMKEKLFNSNFSFLILGQVSSLLGNLSLKFALSMYILEQTGSASLFAG